MKAHCQLVHNFVYVRQVFGSCTVVERSGFLHIDKRTKIVDRDNVVAMFDKFFLSKISVAKC